MWCLFLSLRAWIRSTSPSLLSVTFSVRQLTFRSTKAWKACFPDRQFWPDCPAAAVRRRLSPWSPRPYRNYPFVPPLGLRSEQQSLRAAPGWEAAGRGSTASGHCSLCSSGDDEDNEFLSYIRGKEMLRKGVVLWRPAPRRSPCRSVRSETGSPAYQSLSRADWRLEIKVEGVLMLSPLSLHKRRPQEKFGFSHNQQFHLSSSRN